MRDVRDNEAPIHPDRPAGASESVDFDPSAPPRMAWSNELPSERAPLPSSPPVPTLLAWIVLCASVTALVGISTNPAARYELVRWVTFHHARQAYELIDWAVNWLRL